MGGGADRWEGTLGQGRLVVMHCGSTICPVGLGKGKGILLLDKFGSGKAKH